ncbi:MAG TPA: hypothetical protein VGH96_13950 [Streptosporangiaceae bacterium]|jgi:hypothetical protein
MKLPVWMPAAGLAVMLTACAVSGPAPHAGPATSVRRPAQGGDGKVVGTFVRVGGPLGPGGTQPPDVPLSGTVQFTAAHRGTVAVWVGKSGRFSVWLPAGAYRVSGRSPSIVGLLASGAEREDTCPLEVPVHVVAGRALQVAVVCSVP